MKYSKHIKKILYHSGLLKWGASRRNGKTVAILRYHSIAEPERNYYCQPNIALHPEIFERHVEYFSKNFNVISLDEVKECIQSRKRFPDKAVVFTFDDGYEDNYTAYKILKKFNATGTFYIVTSCIDNAEVLWLFEVIYLLMHTRIPEIKLNTLNGSWQIPLISIEEKQKATRQVTAIIKSNDLNNREEIRNQIHSQINDVNDYHEKASKVMLSWDQVKQMSDGGMTIGGHTMTHLNLPNANPEDALNEIEECKAVIEEKIGRSAAHFSYPNGGKYDYYNKDIINMVKETGFQTATTSNNGTADITSDPYTLKRIRVTRDLSEIMYQICVE